MLKSIRDQIGIDQLFFTDTAMMDACEAACFPSRHATDFVLPENPTHGLILAAAILTASSMTAS